MAADHQKAEEFVRDAARLGFRIPIEDAQRLSARFTQVDAALEGIRQLDATRFEPAVSLDLTRINRQEG